MKRTLHFCPAWPTPNANSTRETTPRKKSSGGGRNQKANLHAQDSGRAQSLRVDLVLPYLSLYLAFAKLFGLGASLSPLSFKGGSGE